MQRRQVLKGMLSSAALAALTPKALAMQHVTDVPDWTLGWQSVFEDHLSPMTMNLQGRIPEKLQGNFLRNGPARFKRGESQFKHWFDGDGMIQKFLIEGQSVSHQGRFLMTERFTQETAQGRYMFSGTGSNLPNESHARNNDTLNNANTAILPWGDDILALWEGGSAYRFDLDSLKTKGLKTWSDALAHIPFSAHPLIENDGSMWNFGLAPYSGASGKLIIYRVLKDEGVSKAELVSMPFGGYVHDFAMTVDKLIFYVPPYHYQYNSGSNYVERFQWEPKLGGKLLIVDKNDLSSQRWIDAPSGFVFHFGQARQRSNELLLTLCWYNDPDVMSKGMYDLLIKPDAAHYSRSHASVMRINLKTGTTKLEQSAVELEFPGFDEQRNSGLADVFGVSKSQKGKKGFYDTLVRWNPNTDQTDSYYYGNGVIAEEPLFVADNTSRVNDGWLIQTYLNCNNRQTGLNIFRADDIAQGPIANATMPRSLPLGFHGAFVGAS